MNCEVHLCCYNEAEILPFTLRHYATFCQRIVLHDNYSTDDSRKIAKAAGAEVKAWGVPNVIDEAALCGMKNNAWRGTTADWVIVGDADEFIYFPQGAFSTLSAYERNLETVIKPQGFEMFSEDYPKGGGQIYDLMPLGAPDVRWYSKPSLFSPKRVASITYEYGAHRCGGMLKDGTPFGNPTEFTDPPTYLLHYKHIGGVERLARIYDKAYSRQTALAHQMGWGNQDPGLKHAQEKRKAILANIQQVIV